jgi:hypothetical protein|tara:strand:+ start:21269 stop:21676 length:408 start_codon:yes stop_codon:yes gene_type:complete
MAKPTINLITSPDKVHSSELSFLLINPSSIVKEQFNDVIKEVKRTVNLYLYEEFSEAGYGDTDVEWLLEVLHMVDYVILDIDNTKNIEWLVGHILSFDKTYYLTTHPLRSYNILNTNRVFDIKQIAEGVNYFAKA